MSLEIIKTVKRDELPDRRKYAKEHTKLIRSLHTLSGDEGLQVYVESASAVSRISKVIEKEFKMRKWQVSQRKRDKGGFDVYIFPLDARTV